MSITQMAVESRRIFHRRAAGARGGQRVNTFNVLILDVSHQRAVLGPLLERAAGRP